MINQTHVVNQYDAKNCEKWAVYVLLVYLWEWMYIITSSCSYNNWKLNYTRNKNYLTLSSSNLLLSIIWEPLYCCRSLMFWISRQHFLQTWLFCAYCLCFLGSLNVLFSKVLQANWAISMHSKAKGVSMLCSHQMYLPSP